MLETLLKPFADYFMSLGLSGIAIVAFLEAIFFPLPPEVLLFTCALCKSQNAIIYALVAGVASAFGAATNYMIGQQGGRRLFLAIFKDKKNDLEKIEKMYQKYGILTVFIVAVTPIPFMVFTMASGLFNMSFFPFVITCWLGRTMRYLAFASLTVYFGNSIKENIDVFFSILAIVIVIVYMFLNRPKKEKVAD